MFCCVRRASPWAKEAVGLPARGCLFRDSVSSVCSVDFLVAYGKILKDPCRPCDIFRVLLAERTAYESSSVCTHINAAVFLHVSANVEDKTILVVVIVDAHQHFHWPAHDENYPCQPPQVPKKHHAVL